jgi:hypothetical protein
MARFCPQLVIPACSLICDDRHGGRRCPEARDYLVRGTQDQLEHLACGPAGELPLRPPELAGRRGEHRLYR